MKMWSKTIHFSPIYKIANSSIHQFSSNFCFAHFHENQNQIKDSYRNGRNTPKMQLCNSKSYINFQN